MLVCSDKSRRFHKRRCCRLSHCKELYVNLLSSTLPPFLQFKSREFHGCVSRKLDGKPEAATRLVRVDPGAGSSMFIPSRVFES